MTYQTILVHLNDSRRAEAVLEPATQLATRFNSHLIGLHVYAAVPAPPIPMTSAALGSIVAAERKNSEAIADTFQRLTRNKQFVAEWQLQKVPHVDLARVVMERGRAADLIVAAQTDPDWDLSPLLDFPERLALESGRPVLIIPYAGHYASIGRRVVIAWNAGRSRLGRPLMHCRCCKAPTAFTSLKSRTAAMPAPRSHPTLQLQRHWVAMASSRKCARRSPPT